MRRELFLAAGLAGLVAAPAAAQTNSPRSATYLFASTVGDVRASWLNPAGLAVHTEASIMAEAVADRCPERCTGRQGVRLGQYTLGFNSRGLSFIYQRDRFSDGARGNTYRLGLGFGSGRTSLGTALTLYRGTRTKEHDFDFGARYVVTPAIDVGAVIRHVSRPVVRGIALPVTGVASAAATLRGGLVQVALEAIAAERQFADGPGPRARGEGSGIDASYRAGLRVTLDGPLPVGVLATVQLGPDLSVDRWSVGLAFGGADRGILLGSAVRRDAAERLDQISLTGVASRELPGLR